MSSEQLFIVSYELAIVTMVTTTMVLFIHTHSRLPVLLHTQLSQGDLHFTN